MKSLTNILFWIGVCAVSFGFGAMVFKDIQIGFPALLIGAILSYGMDWVGKKLNKVKNVKEAEE